MTSREYLTQVKRFHDLLEEEESDLDDEKEEAETDIPANGKEGYLKRIELLEMLYERKKEYYPRLQARIRRKILTLTIQRERQVLILRYIDFLEWDEIAKKMDCTLDGAYGVHKRALQHLIVE